MNLVRVSGLWLLAASQQTKRFAAACGDTAEAFGADLIAPPQRSALTMQR